MILDMEATEVKWYKPREIARLGLIRNSKNSSSEDANYLFIIALINSGRLKAKDYSTKSRRYYLVSEKEIHRYNEEGA